MSVLDEENVLMFYKEFKGEMLPQCKEWPFRLRLVDEVYIGNIKYELKVFSSYQMVSIRRLPGPKNPAEMTYYVQVDGSPITGTTVAKTLNTVDSQTMALTLGYFVQIQAERMYIFHSSSPVSFQTIN